MSFNDIEELESSLTREELIEFNKSVVDITTELHAKRSYDSAFIYSPFNDMNIRTAIYLGYLMGLSKKGKV